MKSYFILLTFFVSCSQLLNKKRQAIVYFHGMGNKPLHGDRVIIDEIKSFARINNYKFFSPQSERSCYYLNPPKENLKCWDHKDIASHYNKVNKELDLNSFDEVVLVGFSNGGYFLGGLIQKSLISPNVTKVAIISGGVIGNRLENAKSFKYSIYIENGASDRWNKKWVKQLFIELKDKGKTFYREVKRGHLMSKKHTRSFLAWTLK